MYTIANKLILGAMIASIIFIMIGHIYREQVQARLKTPLYTAKEVILDWWSVSHFLLFAFFGFVKPGYPLAFFTAGVFFEIFEDGMASDETTQLVNCTHKKERNSVIGGILCNGVQDGCWYGKVDDIFMNLLGYVVGQAIRTTCYPNIIKDE